MRKQLLAILVALIAAFGTSAQITYPSTDYGVAGDSLFYTKVTLSTQQVYYFFQAGANQTWNYSTFTPTTQYYEDYLSPATAGYRATFLTECVGGGSTLGTCRTDFNNLTNLAIPTNQNTTISTYTFTNVIDMDDLSAASLETNILGLTARLNGINVPLTTTLTSPDVVYAFPIAYGSRDSSVSGYVIDLTSQGINLIYHAHSKRVNHDDAWGNLTTPYTNYPSTVRQRSTVVHTDTLFYQGSVIPIAPTTNVTYSWFADAQKGPVFIADGYIGGGGQEYYSRIEYLDTIHCLTPAATQVHNPALPTIGYTGSVNVNFNSTSNNANSYTWSFGDPGSGANNISTATNATHSYTTTGTYSCELIACNTVCSPEKCDTDFFTVKVVDSGQVHAAFIAKPATTCTNDTVKFTNNSLNATSYSWNFGDNTTSTLAAPFHIYTTGGTYLVTLVASGGGLNDTATRTVTIQAAPAPLITPNGPTSFCNGDSVILAGSGGNIYHWSTGQVSDNITVRVSGTYTLTVQNTCGTAVSTPVTITVNRPVDTITALGATTFCGGDSVILSGNTGSGLTYQWRDNGQIIINAIQSTYKAKTSGTYTLNVTSNGCRGLSNAITVTVNPLPAADITVTSSTVICSGDSLKLTASLNAANSYQWQLNGANITGATGRIYYAHSAGTYTVFISRNGCSATSNGIAVTVNPTPSPLIVTSGSNAVCSGDSVLLSTQSGAGYTYQWLLGGTAITGATSETYYAKTQGSYTVSVSAAGCSATSPAQAVVINPLPIADAGPGATLAGCNAPSATLGDGGSTASGGTGPYYYLWSPAASLSSDTIADPTVSHLGSTQTYTLVVTDANGCRATSSATVTVTGSHVAISVALTGDSSWCFGSNNTLTMAATVTGSTGAVTYQWTPATDLSAPTSATTVASPTAVGSYTYNIVATDAQACQAGTSVTINIYPQPTASITANNATNPCAGDTVNLSAATGAGYSYQWLDGGSPISGATNVNFATISAGSYSVSVTEGICSASSTPLVVTVRPVPPAVISTYGSLTFCAGLGVGIQASVGNYGYQWFENGQSISADTAGTIVVHDSGTYNVVVTENGCSATSNSLTTNVITNPLDSIAASGNTTFCVGNTVTLYASTGAGYTYIWQNNGGNIGGQTADSLVVDSNGIYNVIVTSQGCAETSLAIPVTVYYYPTASIAASGSVTFCGGDSVSLGAVQGPGYSYQWQNDGTPISGAVTTAITAQDSGLYNVVVTQNGCTDTSNSIYVTVVPLPAAAAYVSNPSGLICPNDSFYVYVAAAPGSAFQWQLDGSNISGATADTFATNVLGTYNVLVTNGGCVGVSNPLTVATDNFTPTITIAGNSLVASAGIAYQWYAGTTLITGATQQTYSPPSAGTYSVLVTDSNGCTQLSASFAATGVASISGFAEVSVYPNPAHESVSIAINTTSESTITISMYDIIGHEVATIFSGTEGAGNYVHQAPTAGLASGIYLVKISDGISTIVKKISVQH
jgi:PKD repeat protein